MSTLFLTFFLCACTIAQQYVFVSLNYSADQAEQYCIDTYSTHLASIHSTADNDEAWDTCQSIGYKRDGCTIGLTDKDNERGGLKDGWIWLDGSLFGYNNWNNNEPNNYPYPSGEDCVILWKNMSDATIPPVPGSWNDIPCDGDIGTSGATSYFVPFLCNSPPTTSPTKNPSNSPTKNPSNSPTKNPSNSPTKNPSNSPSKYPSNSPSKNPSKSPTKTPSNSPSKYTSNSPSKNPSNSPTRYPSKSPSLFPSINPTEIPTGSPSEIPTIKPTTNTLDPTISCEGGYGVGIHIKFNIQLNFTVNITTQIKEALTIAINEQIDIININIQVQSTDYEIRIADQDGVMLINANVHVCNMVDQTILIAQFDNNLETSFINKVNNTKLIAHSDDIDLELVIIGNSLIVTTMTTINQLNTYSINRKRSDNDNIFWIITWVVLGLILCCCIILGGIMVYKCRKDRKMKEQMGTSYPTGVVMTQHINTYEDRDNDVVNTVNQNITMGKGNDSNNDDDIVGLINKTNDGMNNNDNDVVNIINQTNNYNENDDVISAVNKTNVGNETTKPNHIKQRSFVVEEDGEKDTIKGDNSDSDDNIETHDFME